MDQKQAMERIKNNKDIIILDVRTPDEYHAGHIKGAIVLPVESIGLDNPALLPDKGSEILVYCRSGSRSKKAAEKLARLGYTNVQDIGGILSWPFEIVKE